MKKTRGTWKKPKNSGNTSLNSNGGSSKPKLFNPATDEPTSLSQAWIKGAWLREHG